MSKDIDELADYLSTIGLVTESFRNVNVDYIAETGELYIDDAETDEQLAVFKCVIMDEKDDNEH